MFNSAEYLTASKIVACKKINANKFEIYILFKACSYINNYNKVNRQFVHRDVIQYLKKGFFLERGMCIILCYLLRQIPRNTEFPRTNTSAMEKAHFTKQ